MNTPIIPLINVNLRIGGAQPHDDLPLLIRLGTDNDINMTIKHALGSYIAYAALGHLIGQPTAQGLLTLSAYALPDDLSVSELMGQVTSRPYEHYRCGRYGEFKEARLHVLPTEVFRNGKAEPRNDLHFDVIVPDEHHVLPDDYQRSDKAERTRLRQLMEPAFNQALAPFGALKDA